MISRWLTTTKRRLQNVGGALAVLLMFFVPVTRVVLAATAASAGNAMEPAAVGSGTGKGTGVGGSGTGPTTPANPSPNGSSHGTNHNHTGRHTGHRTKGSSYMPEAK